MRRGPLPPGEVGLREGGGQCELLGGDGASASTATSLPPKNMGSSQDSSVDGSKPPIHAQNGALDTLRAHGKGEDWRRLHEPN